MKPEPTELGQQTFVPSCLCVRGISFCAFVLLTLALCVFAHAESLLPPEGIRLAPAKNKRDRESVVAEMVALAEHRLRLGILFDDEPGAGTAGITLDGVLGADGKPLQIIVEPAQDRLTAGV